MTVLSVVARWRCSCCEVRPPLQGDCRALLVAPHPGCRRDRQPSSSGSAEAASRLHCLS